MSFDEIPENIREGYLCPKCGGSVEKSFHNKKLWICDTCDFYFDESAFFKRQLEYIKSRTYDVKYKNQRKKDVM